MATLRRPTRLLLRTLAGMLGLLVLLVAGFAVFIAINGWNWARGPIERQVAAKTGREFRIEGDLRLHWAWPAPIAEAQRVRFANPGWAREPQMVRAEAVRISLSLPRLWHREVIIPEVSLTRPEVYLEIASEGRKSWLLDREQKDEGARVAFERLTLDEGVLGFDDGTARTSLRARLSTRGNLLDAKAAPGSGVQFAVQGLYKNQPLEATGTGGPVLALRDDTHPYPLTVAGTVANTQVKAEGTITGLTTLRALDMRLDLRGQNLQHLYPVLGLAFPATPPYATQGRLRHAERWWDYQDFSGRVGKSDLAGNLRVDNRVGARPFLQADLRSKVLDLEDLGPLIGARPGSVDQARAAAPPAAVAMAQSGTPARAHVLPEIPFNSARWDVMDADVKLKAGTIRRAEALPLENLETHLVLKDKQLRLEPLNLGFAGGELRSIIALDGAKQPIEAHARVRARDLRMAELLPTVDLNKNSVGQINGHFDLRGRGNSVRSMLASSDGTAGLVVGQGEVSRLMMETIGLHLWEMLQLNLGGDHNVTLRCGVADFAVRDGNMLAQELVVDTAVTTVVGSGNIDLDEEKLDLRLETRTKRTSPLALSTPILVRGHFARPDVGIDKMQAGVRAAGAVALAAINPLLAFVPLVDPGPGADRDCRQIAREARQAKAGGRAVTPAGGPGVAPAAEATTPPAAARRARSALPAGDR